MVKIIQFINIQDLDNTDKIHQADNKSLLDKLIYQESNFSKTLIPKSKLSDNSLFDNINDISEIKESASIDEKIEKNNDRVKRDLRASTSELLWAKSNTGGISEHLLKLNDGNKVLKSEKATVAEALNGPAAISKILAQAKAKAAKAAKYKNLYDNDDFSTWLLSESPFDTNIFKYPFRPSHNTKIIDNNENNHLEIENADNQHEFSISRSKSKSTNHDHREIKHTLSDSTVDIADIDRSTKLLHKSEHQKHPSSKLRSTSGEKHGHDTNEMLHKLTVSRHTHELSSYEDEEDTGLQHTSSHVYAPHMDFRITKDQEAGNNIPKRKHAKWTRTDYPRAQASHASHSAESYEFETSDEEEGYRKKFIFKTLFEPGEDVEKIYIKPWEAHKFLEKININEEDETNYNKFAESLFQYDSSIDSFNEKDIRNRNKQNLNEIQRSIVHSTTSAETKEGIENKQSGNMLITKIFTGISTQEPVNIDIKHYHSRDQSSTANNATSFSSSLSDDKGNKRINNVLALPSINNGSKTKNEYGLLGRTHSTIDNDVTSTEIKMDFSGIKSYPPIGSSLSHSKTHLGNQKVHHSISGYEGSTVSSKTKHLDPKTLMGSQNKNHNNLKINQEITTTATSIETIPSINENHYRAVSSDKQISNEEVSDEQNYIKTRKKYIDLNGKDMDYRTSIEVVDIDDCNAKLSIPKFPVHKHGKAYTLYDINYDFDSREIDDDEKIESAKDLKRIQVDYDNLNQEKKFTDNVKISKESQMITSDKHLSYDRHSQYEKSDKHNQHNYRSHNKQNCHKDNNKSNLHRTYNQYKHRNQDNYHSLNQQADSMKSSTASDETEFDRNRYIYFIQEQKQRNNESNASLESSIIKEGKKQNNAKHEKILLNGKEKKYVSGEDKHRYLKKHTNLSGPVMQSIEINKITSSNEGKIESQTNIKNRNKIVARVKNLISDGSTVDTTLHTELSNKKPTKTINNNNNFSQISWELMSLKNPHADVQRETERVYDTYGGSENVDINTKQTVKAAQSTESKSNLQSTSLKTSESNNTKKIVAIQQVSDEKISSNGTENGYQDYNDKISGSSKSKLQTNTIRHSNKKLKSEINANVKTLIKVASSNDTMDKSRSNIQNAIASSTASAKSQIGSWNYQNNKKYNTNAKASADATIFVGVKNKQKSILENTSTFPKLKSEVESEKYSNDLKNSIAISTAKSGVIPGTANNSSIKSKIKMEQTLNYYNSDQRDANVKTSSTATSNNVKNEWLLQNLSSSKMSHSKSHLINNEDSSKMSHSESHLINNEDNQINSISKASADSTLHNIIKDKNRFHLKKAFSSSSVPSSEKSQAEYKHDNLQKNRINVSPTEVSIQSTVFNNSDNGYWLDLSKSILSSKWLKEKHIKNKHYSDNMKISHKDNIDTTTKIGETVSNVIRNSYQDKNPQQYKKQESINSLSSSSSFGKSQILNKNGKASITSNNIFDMNEHNVLHTSSSSQTASKNNLNIQKNEPKTANTTTLTISALINHDKYRQKDNILKAKLLSDPTNKNNIKKFVNNDSIEKDEIIIPKLKNASNAVTSVKTVTSTGTENVIKASSSSNSKAKSGTHKEYDLNQLKKEKTITNDLAASKISNNIENKYKNKWITISSLTDSHSRSEEEKKNHMDIVENNKKSMDIALKSFSSTNNKQSQNDLVKEATLSEISKEAQKRRNNFNMSKEKFKNIANQMTMETISNSANNVYHNDLLKDKSVISNEKIQTNNKIKDRNEINADNSDIKSKINSGRVKGDNNIDKLSMDLATLNSFNSENGNNILKVISDDLYAEVSQRDQHKSDILSNVNRKANTNIQDKHRHGLIFSIDTEIQSMIDHKSDILRKKEAVNSETRNNINKWNTKFQTISSSSNAKSQNKKETIVKTVSPKSTVNNKKDAYDSMQEKSVFDPTNIVKIDKQYRLHSNHKADMANTEGARAEVSNSQRFIEHFKNDAKEKKSQQNKLKHHKIVTSDIEFSKGTNSNKMENVHQELLKDATASNSRTKVQHKYSDILKEGLKVTGRAATSAQAKSLEEVESKSKKKLIRDSAKSNSYAKSQIESKNYSNAPKEERINASIETLKNSAISDNFENVRQDKLNKNLLSDSKLHDTHTRNENRRKILKNNLDAIVSTKETSSNIIKDKYQDGVKMISKEESLSNSYAEIQKRGYDSNLRRKSTQMTSSSDIKEYAENKNTINNIGKSLKAHNIVTSAISSNNVKSTNTQDPSHISSSSNLYTASQIDNIHSRNALNDKKRMFMVTQAPTSLVTSINNQNKQKEILHIEDSKNQKIMKAKQNNNNFLRQIYNGEDAAALKQAISNVKYEHQNNLLKATSLINPFADTQNMQKSKSKIYKKQHLITSNSIASSDSNISSYIDRTSKYDPEKLTGTSSNFHAKSKAQNKNHTDILKNKTMGILNKNKSGHTIISNEFKDTEQNKLSQVTSSSNSYTETEIKNNNIKKALDAALKTISFNDIKNIDPNSLFNLLINPPSKLTENKNIFQKDVIIKNLSETLSDLFSKTQSESANSKIMKDDYENSATVNTMIKTKSSNYPNQQEDLYKTRSFSSNAPDSQHNIKSISSGNSYVTIPATNEIIVENGKVKKDGEIIFNLSTLGGIKMYNKIKKEHLNNWPSDTFAEEHTDKDKFNDSKTTEKVAIHSGTAEAATTNNIETKQHDIHLKDRSKLEDSWNAETKIQNAISDASAEMIALKRIKNKSEGKNILDDKLATLSSNDAHTKTQVINKEKYGIMGTSDSSVNAEETQRSLTSAISSASATISNNMNINLDSKYDQINNKMSTTSLITSVSKDTKGRKNHLSSARTSLHLSDKINGCDKDVETREFISQVSNLYKVNKSCIFLSILNNYFI